MQRQEQETSLSEALEGQEGFVAPRYRSGQRSADALLEAGRSLLTRISYEGLNVRELCRDANLTTGAFYRRFESKEAFFLALQRLAVDDANRLKETLLSKLDCYAQEPLTLRDYAHIVLDAMCGWFAQHQGVLRASIQHHERSSADWQPFTELREGMFSDLSARIAHLPELRARNDALSHLKVAFQIVNGAMVNAALNDPGPLRLTDPAFPEALAKMFASYLCADE
jgi:AcrR family transcriptional regulator